MNENDARSVYALLFLLLVIAAILVYLDWRKQGEIDHLHERVDRMGDSPVARILRARDDVTAETIAREEA